MDDTLQELDYELKALAPLRPSSGLQARLGRELDPADSRAEPGPVRSALPVFFRSWQRAVWPLAAAAAVVLLASLVIWRRPLVTQAVVPAPTVAAAPADPSPVADFPPSSAAGAREVYHPVAATNVLYDLRDEGPASATDNTSGRRLRYRYVDTYTWRNSATHASLKWSVPRDEVRVIPASFH